MNVLPYLVLLVLAFGCGAMGVFMWASKSGQFDDLETPAHTLLQDEESHADKAN
jgi:cbb3-type cytochrome oxidase maturation protein